jgi:hypothetical protein
MSKRLGMNDPETKLVSKEDLAAAAALNGIEFKFRSCDRAGSGGWRNICGRTSARPARIAQ